MLPIMGESMVRHARFPTHSHLRSLSQIDISRDDDRAAVPDSYFPGQGRAGIVIGSNAGTAALEKSYLALSDNQ